MSAAELSIGITCMCLTTYKPLFRHYFPSTRRSGSSPEDSGTPKDSNASSPNLFRRKRDPWLEGELSDESSPNDLTESWAAKERDAQIYSLFVNPAVQQKSVAEIKTERPPSSFSI